MKTRGSENTPTLNVLRSFLQKKLTFQNVLSLHFLPNYTQDPEKSLNENEYFKCKVHSFIERNLLLLYEIQTFLIDSKSNFINCENNNNKSFLTKLNEFLDHKLLQCITEHSNFLTKSDRNQENNLENTLNYVDEMYKYKYQEELEKDINNNLKKKLDESESYISILLENLEKNGGTSLKKTLQKLLMLEKNKKILEEKCSSMGEEASFLRREIEFLNVIKKKMNLNYYYFF